MRMPFVHSDDIIVPVVLQLLLAHYLHCCVVYCHCTFLYFYSALYYCMPSSEALLITPRKKNHDTANFFVVRAKLAQIQILFGAR